MENEKGTIVPLYAAKVQHLVHADTVVALCTCLQMNTSSGRNGSSIEQNP